ncbi:MAG: radical SAM protein [Nanoarchaeota archaeon]|nr:radical SAM protein [Nanoarchaeota archaeon]
MDTQIKNINIAVTNRCNLKCIMCDIWQEIPKIDLPLYAVEKILQSKRIDKDVDITLTGGEPFLNENLFEITKAIIKKKPNSLQTISTNGILTNRIIDYLAEFSQSLPKGFSLHISMDGLTSHDKQRGADSLNRIKDTIKRIKADYPSINIKIKFTITPLNYLDILPTYAFCKNQGLGFRVKLVEYAENYTNKNKGEKFNFTGEMKREIAKQLVCIYYKKKVIDKENAEFIKNTIKNLFGKQEKSLCKTPFERIFIMPDCDVYSCIHFKKIGNLNENALDDIWESPKAQALRYIVQQEQCAKCVSYHGLTL